MWQSALRITGGDPKPLKVSRISLTKQQQLQDIQYNGLETALPYLVNVERWFPVDPQAN